MIRINFRKILPSLVHKIIIIKSWKHWWVYCCSNSCKETVGVTVFHILLSHNTFIFLQSNWRGNENFFGIGNVFLLSLFFFPCLFFGCKLEELCCKKAAETLWDSRVNVWKPSSVKFSETAKWLSCKHVWWQAFDFLFSTSLVDQWKTTEQFSKTDKHSHVSDTVALWRSAFCTILVLLYKNSVDFHCKNVQKWECKNATG